MRNQKRLALYHFPPTLSRLDTATTELVYIAHFLHCLCNKEIVTINHIGEIIIDSFAKKPFRLHFNLFIIYDLYRILESYYHIMFPLHF